MCQPLYLFLLSFFTVLCRQFLGRGMWTMKWGTFRWLVGEPLDTWEYRMSILMDKRSDFFFFFPSFVVKISLSSSLTFLFCLPALLLWTSSGRLLFRVDFGWKDVPFRLLNFRVYLIELREITSPFFRVYEILGDFRSQICRVVLVATRSTLQ